MIVGYPKTNQICLKKHACSTTSSGSSSSSRIDELFLQAVDDYDTTDNKFIDCARRMIAYRLTLVSHLDEIWHFNTRTMTPSTSMLTRQSLRPRDVRDGEDELRRKLVCYLPDNTVIGLSSFSDMKGIKGMNGTISEIVCMSADLQATYWRKKFPQQITLVEYIPPLPHRKGTNVYLEMFAVYFPMDICRLIVEYLLV